MGDSMHMYVNNFAFCTSIVLMWFNIAEISFECNAITPLFEFLIFLK
jgi:hypothetical protein